MRIIYRDEKIGAEIINGEHRECSKSCSGEIEGDEYGGKRKGDRLKNDAVVCIGICTDLIQLVIGKFEADCRENDAGRANFIRLATEKYEGDYRENGAVCTNLISLVTGKSSSTEFDPRNSTVYLHSNRISADFVPPPVLQRRRRRRKWEDDESSGKE